MKSQLHSSCIYILCLILVFARAQSKQIGKSFFSPTASTRTVSESGADEYGCGKLIPVVTDPCRTIFYVRIQRHPSPPYLQAWEQAEMEPSNDIAIMVTSNTLTGSNYIGNIGQQTTYVTEVKIYGDPTLDRPTLTSLDLELYGSFTPNLVVSHALLIPITYDRMSRWRT